MDWIKMLRKRSALSLRINKVNKIGWGQSKASSLKIIQNIKSIISTITKVDNRFIPICRKTQWIKKNLKLLNSLWILTTSNFLNQAIYIAVKKVLSYIYMMMRDWMGKMCLQRLIQSLGKIKTLNYCTLQLLFKKFLIKAW